MCTPLSRLSRLFLCLILFCAAAPAAPARAQEATESDSVVVLMYHRFGEPAYGLTDTPLDLFERQLAILAEGGYRVLPLPEVAAALESGAQLPERSVVITIDDAYLSVYREAWPRLRAAGLPFTLFTATEAIDGGGAGFMSWDQLRELAADPLVSLGSQTRSHPHMPGRSLAENRADVLAGSARFAAELGAAPRLFAYPYGEYDLENLALIRELGFDLAFSQPSGAIDMTRARRDPLLRYALPRFVLNATYGQPDRFRLAIDSLPLPVSEETPESPLLPQQDAGVAFAFSVDQKAGGLERLRCYANWDATPQVAVQARRVTVTMAAAPGRGRWRVNCTLPAGEGRWYWYARLFYRGQ
ncbi:MAG: polysaccharide deacetylase family protein [Rhodovibrionaceae bacterium]